MILGCEDCGENLPYVEVYGQHVGGAELEGMIFHFYPNRSVKVREADAKDFDLLPRVIWLKRVQQHVMDGADDVMCPKCRKQAYVEE